MDFMADLICVSHLRWTDGWQRQKQVLSRLARGGRVLFVEEPVPVLDEAEPRLDLLHETDRITIARLIHPAPYGQSLGHGNERCVATYIRLLCQYLMQERYDNPILWLYTRWGWSLQKRCPTNF
jgi:UDP-galactopyranose mutase